MMIIKTHLAMRRVLQHKFVEYIPAQPDEGTLYISVQYKTVEHLCICGCGNKVVTPITPNDWRLTFDGVSVSLYPSIGNWSFPCRTHYFVTNNKIEMMRNWSENRIKDSREDEQKRKNNYYSKKSKTKGNK